MTEPPQSDGSTGDGRGRLPKYGRVGDRSAGRLISCVLSVPYVSAFVLVSRGKPSPWTSGH